MFTVLFERRLVHDCYRRLSMALEDGGILGGKSEPIPRSSKPLYII